MHKADLSAGGEGGLNLPSSVVLLPLTLSLHLQGLLSLTLNYNYFHEFKKYKLDRGSIRSSPRNGIEPVSNKNMGFWSQFGIWTPPWRPKLPSYSLTQKFWEVDNLLLDHVGLPHVLVLVVHLVIFGAGWVGGIIPKHFYYYYFASRALLHA